MTLTLLLAVTLAPGRRAWPGAALPHPPRPAPSGLGPRRPPQGTCASCLAALDGEVAEAQAHWGGVGGGEGVESQNYSAQLHSLPRNRVLYFSSSCLVLRCGKGEKQRKISHRFSRWQTKLRGTPSSGETVQGRQIGFVPLSNVRFNWNFEAS